MSCASPDEACSGPRWSSGGSLGQLGQGFMSERSGSVSCPVVALGEPCHIFPSATRSEARVHGAETSTWFILLSKRLDSCDKELGLSSTAARMECPCPFAQLPCTPAPHTKESGRSRKSTWHQIQIVCPFLAQDHLWSFVFRHAYCFIFVRQAAVVMYSATNWNC